MLPKKVFGGSIRKRDMKSKLHEFGSDAFGQRSTRAVSIASLMSLEGVSAIDLGSNEGYNSFDLKEHGCSTVLGVEGREKYLKIAEKERIQLGYSDVSFKNLDVRKIDQLLKRKFDLCLCSGLLYHLQNPIDFLCRLRKICEVLALETHIAPEWYSYFLAGTKYRGNLDRKKSTIEFAGVQLTGRYNNFPSEVDMGQTSGSLETSQTFWLDKESLKKGLELAGFSIRAFYFSTNPRGYPRIPIRHGFRRTKVFMLAE